MTRTIKQFQQPEESNSDGVPGSAAPVEDSSGVGDEDYGLPVMLTVEEAARFLRVNVKTLYESVNAGNVPARKIGKRVVIFREALLSWLRSSERVLPLRRGAT